jgi:Family of unknown function (DUF6850)
MNLNNKKHMIKTKNITAIFLLSVSMMSAQGLLFKKNNLFNTLFSNKTKVNSYYIGHNPAYLNLEESDERLLIQSYFNNTDGAFKSFLDPGTSRNYQLNFSGKKQITDNQVFKGSFAFQNEERMGWDWLATKHYDTGSPFLLGDSTSGATRYNSMILNAEYSGKIFNRLLVGFSLSYGVDEGLKKVTPRPISEHRDLFFNFGIGYLFDEFTSIGLVSKTYDFNEKIIYKEDQGGLYNETIIFKLRGYDFPLKYYKKTETRYSYHNGYAGTITFQHSTNLLNLAVAATIEMENISIQDGKNDPQPEGYWKNDKFEGETQLLLYPAETITCGFYYKFDYSKMWARHPIFKSTLTERETPTHSISAGIELALTEDLAFGVEMSAATMDQSHNDYYSDISWENQKLILAPKFGINYRWNDWLQTYASYEFTNCKVDKKELLASEPTDFYNNFRSFDIQYNLSDFNVHSAYLKTTIVPTIIGEFNIYIIYSKIQSDKNSYFNGSSRSSITGVVEYRVAAY